MELYFSNFKSRLQKMAALSEQDWEQIAHKLEIRYLSAGQLLTGLGRKDHYFIYVCEGLFRETENNEVQLSGINRYLLPGSVFVGIDPETTARIEAIQDGVILLLSEQDVFKLENEHRTFRKHFRLFLIQYVNDLRLRGDILSCKNGTLKYQFFYQHYEEICRSQPLAEQARYLNLNKDTVCRLRARHFPDDDQVAKG